MNQAARIHAFYILLILSATIISLISVNWIAIPDLPELITFALTITSLVLAVLAIVYAYISQESNTHTIARLSQAATDIVNSAEDVRNATISLGAEVASLPEMISSVGARVDQASALWKEASSQQTAAVSVESPPKKPDEAFFRRFVAVSSVSGVLLLLACKKAAEKKKAVNLAELAKLASLSAPDYLHGYLVAAAAAGIVEYTGPATALVVSSVASAATLDLEGRTLRKIEKAATTAGMRTRMINAIAGVSRYFDDQPVPPIVPSEPNDATAGSPSEPGDSLGNSAS